MFESKSLWETEFFRLSKAEAEIAPRFCDWLSKSPSRLGRFLADVQYGSNFEAFTYRDVRELEAMIVKASARKEDALPPLRLLRKVVYHLNRALQLSIPHPTLAIHLTPPPNPFLSNDVSLAHQSVEAWLRAEKQWLADLRKAPDFRTRDGCNVPLELLLFSAALHGGILDRDLAFAVYVALREPEKYFRYTSTRSYVDLPVAWFGKRDQEIRRWYPDDALVCLMARLITPEPTFLETGKYAGQRRAFCDHWAKHLKEGLRHRRVPSRHLPRSIPDLFRKIITVLRSEMPAAMVNYATRQIDARSLLPPSIDSIYGDPGLATLSVSAGHPSGSVDTENDEAYGREGTGDIEPAWMAPLRSCFRAANPKALEENLSGLTNMGSDVAERLIGLANHLIRNGASSGRTIKPVSIRCCVLTVARRLGSQLCERDPADLPVDTLEDLYVNAVDQAAADSINPARLQGTVVWALREFHRYLRREGLVKPINEGDVFRVPRTFMAVDAMIVSIEDVMTTLDYLLYEPNPGWTERNRLVARVTVILGFFAGLRTMEGLGALRKDFPGTWRLPFYVLASKSRGLKTPNAARKINLSEFISPFEDLEQVALEFAKADTVSKPDSLLFEGARDDAIIPMINEALRAATGNDRVRYYNLRHSFASWTITRLLLSELPEIPDLFPHLPKTTAWLQGSRQFRRALYGNDSVHNDHAWALATLLGHSRPSVSFANYCHTLDILLPEFLRISTAFQFALDHRARLKFSGSQRRFPIPESDPVHSRDMAEPDAVCQPDNEEVTSSCMEEASREKTRQEPALPLKGLEKQLARHHVLNLLCERYPNLQAADPASGPGWRHSWFEQTWRLLAMAQSTGHNFDGMIRYLGLSNAEAEWILDRTRQICAAKSPATDERMRAITTVADPTKSTMDCAFPKLPSAAALDRAREIASKVEKSLLRDSATTILLDYFSDHVQPDSATVVFQMGEFCSRRPDVLISEYCRFLASLDIPQEDLRFEGCDGTPSRCAPAEWYEKWGLRPQRTLKIINVHGKRAERVARGEWLSITPTAPATTPATRGARRVFADAFRFSMLLASIRFGSDRNRLPSECINAPVDSGAATEEIVGLVVDVMFFNRETGFSALRLRLEGRQDVVTVIGWIPSVGVKQWLRARGTWAHDGKYGLLFRSRVLYPAAPATREEVERHLGSGFVTGVGPSLAKKMVAHFGAQSLDIIETRPYELITIRGVGPRLWKQIADPCRDRGRIREIMLFLHDHDVDPRKSVKIYEAYGAETVNKIRDNPYDLTKRVPGIDFATADQIARRLGVAADDENRLHSGIVQALLSARSEGHCAYPLKDLKESSSKLLRVQENVIEAALNQMSRSGEIVLKAKADHTLVFLRDSWDAEARVAEAIRRLANSPATDYGIDAKKAIEWCELKGCGPLTSDQKHAIRAALANRLVVITGGPGVGRTDLIRSILLVLRAKRMNCLLCAPTPPAARRLRETTGFEAETIDQLLGLNLSDRKFSRNESNPLQCDLLIVDEMSMVDVPQASALLRALQESASLILMGDAHQISPEGPGNVFADLISSGVVPVVHLTSMFANNARSRLVSGAHEISHGKIPEVSGREERSDFLFVDCDGSQSLIPPILHLLHYRIPDTFGLDPILDVQVLCSMKAGSVQMKKLNLALQRTLNFPAENECFLKGHAWGFRVGDKVVQKRDNYGKQAFKGNIGRIENVDPVDPKVEVRFRDSAVSYAFDELDDLSLAYAISIEQSQGSAFKAVVMPLARGPHLLLQRNLIYSALSCAQQLFVAIGPKTALDRAVNNGSPPKRYSGLLDRLRNSR